MGILLYAVLMAGIALFAYAAYGLLRSGQPGVRKKTESDLKEERTVALQNRIITLEAELERAKSNCVNVQEELAGVKAGQAGLEEELSRRQDWVEKSGEELKKAKEENAALKDKLSAKEKELQAEFSKAVDLDKRIGGFKERTEALEQENRQKTEQIEAQRHEVERYAKEAKKHLEAAAELKKKEENSEWVPKQEFIKLEQEFKESKDKLKKITAGLIRKEELVLTKKETQEPPEPKPAEDPPEAPGNTPSNQPPAVNDKEDL